MQDLRRSRRRVVSKCNNDRFDELEEMLEDTIEEELERCHKHHKHHHDCGCEKDDCEVEYDCEITCKPSKPSCKPDCEPCESCEPEYDQCMDNKCEKGCCNGLRPKKFSISDSIPYAIEVNRIYDTMKFQTFTDGTAYGAKDLYFKYDVVEVDGDIPQGYTVNIDIQKVCLNYSKIVIKQGTVTLENRAISPIKQDVADYENPCPDFENTMDSDLIQNVFEYNVSGDKNRECCSRGKGEKVSYKEKGLKVRVRDLVLELYGKCGCTNVKILATPAKKDTNGDLVEVPFVEFNYSTLTAPCCLPADGKSFVLRREFQTELKVDCIGKCLLKSDAASLRADGEYECCIPNSIDLILCLEEVVSILVNQQIVVLGAPEPVRPRIVDTFTKVCDFNDGCGI